MQLITDFITMPELCRRWQCSFDLICPYTENQLNHRGFPDLPPILQAYKIDSIRECSKGTVRACVASPIELYRHSFEAKFEPWNDSTLMSEAEVVFDIKEVRALEAASPALLCTSVPFDQIQEKAKTEIQDKLELAWKDLESAQLSIADLESQLAAAQQAKQEAEAKLAEMQARQEDKAEDTTCLTSQEKATLKRGENTLEAWKPVVSAMIKIAVRCGAEGPRLRQQPEFNVMFNEIDAEPTTAQTTFFRQCLPDEHIDRVGGERNKTHPSDTEAPGIE